MTVSGTSETIAGNESPNAATILDVPEYVTMAGTATGHYFSSYKRYYTGDVPTADNLNGNLTLQGFVFTSAWVAQGSPGAHMADLTDTDAYYLSYTAAKGTDSECPAYTGKWVDANTVTPADSGNILAPDTADCSAQS
jgi:hypothetical protein